jgi:hypothetical protein
LSDEGERRSYGGFLPPQPPGAEPDLEGPGAAAANPTPPPPQFAPPAEHEANAPAEREGDAAEREYPPVTQQLGWNAQSGASGRQARPPGYAVRPTNGEAVAGLSLSIGSLVLLMLSVGTSTIISIVCSALGITYSRRGRARVQRGETSQYGGIAQAGYVTGIVALVLSILCTLAWVAVAILFATDDQFRQDIKDELDSGDDDPPKGLETSLRLVAVAFRLVAALIR